MLIRVPFLLLAVLGLGIVISFKNQNISVEQIAQKLETWHQIHPQEKVYVHISKSLFLPQDTAYCKVYVVNADGNTPSAISHVAYIDIADNSNYVLKTAIVHLSDGVGWSSIAINNMKAGNYHVRAYTNWMRNNNFFFDKIITVTGDSKQSEKAADPKPYHKTVFFPEGGQMVAGLPARVAFKAIGSSGLGIGVSGAITDENGKEVISFHSGFAGMGSCSFTPLPKQLYNAVVKYDDGFEEKIPLPKAEKTGYTFSINNSDENNIDVTVLSAGTSGDVVLIAQSGGRVMHSANLKLINGASSIKISKKKFPTGIAQLTLFTDKIIPVAERLLFINHQDTLHIEGTLDKLSSAKRQKIKLKLHVADELDEPVTGSFSVGVTEAATAPYDASKDENIRTSLLLTSDLKGYIENPNYYFTNIDSTKIKDLDNLLLTQGWRRFQWDEVLTDPSAPVLYAAEQVLSVSGRVQAKNGKAMPDVNVNLLSKSGSGFLLQTTTDAAGRFRFDSIVVTGDAEFVLKATNKDQTKNLVVIMDTFSSPPVLYKEEISRMTTAKNNRFPAYTAASRNRWEDMKKYGLVKPDAAMLKEVIVKSEKLSKVQQAVAPSYNLNGPGHADQVITYEDLFNCRDISMCLNGKLIGVTFRKVPDPDGVLRTMAFSASGFGVPMRLNVDGVDIPPDFASLDNFPVNDIQSIEVLKSGGYLAVYGMKASYGMLVITTKKGDLDYNHLDNSIPADRSTIFTKVHGYSVHREFYTPDYSSPSSNRSLPDLRSTIYWKPDIVTDENGDATLEWNNSDATGTYNVIVEGISNDGRMGSIHLSYEVK